MSVEVIVLARGVNALGVVRSLGAAGFKSRVVTGPGSDFVFQSKYVTMHEEVVSANEADYIAAIKKVSPGPGSTIIACSDEYINLLEQNQEMLGSEFRFVLPGKGLGSLLIDKSKEVRFMESIGIPVPSSKHSLKDALSAFEEKDYPLIVKPRTYKYLDELGEKNTTVKNKEELEKLVSAAHLSDSNYIIQNIIPGEDECLWVCNCFFDSQARLIGCFTFNRIRTTPPHYGVTSFAISKRNPRIHELCEQIGEKLGYVGPAMIEFKYDFRDSEYKYIEINPRLGMCNFFDTKSNIPNVYNTYALANGLPLKPTTQLDGVYYLNFFEDVRSRVLDGEPKLNIFTSYMPSIISKRVGAFWSITDPKPGLLVACRNIRRLLGVLYKHIKKRAISEQ